MLMFLDENAPVHILNLKTKSIHDVDSIIRIFLDQFLDMYSS